MKRDYVLELRKILKSSLSDIEKKNRIIKYHDSDIADCLETLTKEERLKLYKILGKEILASVFSYFEDVNTYVDELSLDDAADIIELMDSDDAKDILDELRDQSRKEIVELMDHESKSDIRLLTEYDEEQIGSLMTNNYVEIKNTDTVKRAMKKLISLARDFDNISLIYVTDERDKYYGCIELRDLIVARENDDLHKIIKTSYPALYASHKTEDYVSKLREYALDSYPVLADDNTLLGSITQDDITEIVDIELKDDYAKLGGLTEEEDLDESVFASVKKRIPWLIVLLGLGLLESMLLSRFEAIITFLPALVFFQTTVLDMSGNSGTQSLAVTIRLISSDDYRPKDGIKTIFKELRVGFLNAICVAIISFIFVFLYVYLTKTNSSDFTMIDTVKTSSIVSVSLLIAMTLSCVIGSLIPMLFKRIKIDPAVASGPFITTINDICSLLIYYGLSTLLFLLI